MNGFDRKSVFERFKQIALPRDTREKDSDSWDENESRIKIFSLRLANLKIDTLNTFFSDLDTKEKVSCDYVAAKDVSFTAEKLIQCLLVEVQNIDERFRATCIKSGSFYDGLKIGEPDEFDFVVRLEALSKPGVCEARFSSMKKGFVYIVIKDETTKEQFSEFLTEVEDECLDSGDNVLSVQYIQWHFSELISTASEAVTLPPELVNPDRSIHTQGLVAYNHGPCAMLKLQFCKGNVNLNIDIDIAPAIAFPDKSYRPPVLTEYKDNDFTMKIEEFLQSGIEVLLVPFTFDSMEKLPSNSWVYHYSETWRISFSRIEQAIFEMYQTNSVEKMFVRILKVLKESYLVENKEVIEMANTSDIKFEEPPSTKVKITSIVGLCSAEPLKGAHNASIYERKSEFQEENKEHGTQVSSDNSSAQVLYERKPITSIRPQRAETLKDKCEEQDSIKSGEELLPVGANTNFDPPQDGIDEPLMQTYTIKMLFFYLKMIIPIEIWKSENLTSIILVTLEMLFCSYSTKNRNFLHFWFQDFIGKSPRLSTSLEMLHCLEDLVNTLEMK